MKKLLTITIFLTLTFYTFGQTNTNATKNEIGINLYKLSMPSGLIIDKQFANNFVSGLIYKRHLSKYSLRLGLDYSRILDFYTRKSPPPPCCDQFYITGTYKGFNSIIGVEKKVLTGRVRPFLAADFIFLNGLSKYHITGGIAGVNIKDDVWVTGLGIGATAGLNIVLNKNFTFSFETNASAMHFLYSDNKKRNSFFTHSINPIRLISFNRRF